MTDAELSGTHKAIALADAGENFDGQLCEISGWGYDYGHYGDQLPGQLQESNGVILTDNECESDYGTLYNSSAMICSHNRKSGTCQGDSGGPLVCFRGSTPVLAGVTSWGDAVCSTKLSSVFARVSTYRAWLDQTMGI